MKVLVVVAVVALIHGSHAALLIKGPTGPVVEGERVQLECRFSDPEQNISKVHFEVYSKYLESWHRVYMRPWCFNAFYTEQTGDSVILLIAHVGRFTEGPYRCVSDAENVTGSDNSSQPLALKVHYMAELSLSREGYTSYFNVPQELKVQVGDDVVLKCSARSSEEPEYFWLKEGSDWILPSPNLTLKKVTAMDEGQYTCMAEHPSMKSLNKKRTVSITVLSEDAPWYQTSNGRLILMTSAAAVALLVFILSVSVFVCRRAKQARTSKGPIDDRSQKKPIYKGSQESIPSVCGDKQPLV